MTQQNVAHNLQIFPKTTNPEITPENRANFGQTRIETQQGTPSMGLAVPPRVFPHEKSIEPIQKIEEDAQQAPQEVYRKEFRPKLKEGIFIFGGKK
jgi:hypothetical protein